MSKIVKSLCMLPAFLLILALISACGLAANSASVLPVKLSIVSGHWSFQDSGPNSRFLTPDSRNVELSLYSDSALIAEATLAVTAGSGTFAQAQGELAEVPIGIPLVLKAEIRNADGLVISKASSDFTLEAGSTQGVNLVLMPTADNPAMQDVVEGPVTLTIPAGESRILRFTTLFTEAAISWPMKDFTGLFYQVRDKVGTEVSTKLLAGTTEGISFSSTEGDANYLILFNSTESEMSIALALVLAEPQASPSPSPTPSPSPSPSPSPTPQPVLVAVNSIGTAYVSSDSNTWNAGAATGLTAVNDMSYGHGLFVAIGVIGSNYGISTSPDGLIWTAQNLGGTSAYLTQIDINPAGTFVTAGTAGATGQSFVSTDGLNWTGPYSTGVAGGNVGPVWLGTQWFQTSSNASSFKVSTDGITWNTGASTGGIYQANVLFGVNGKMLVGGGMPASTNKQVIRSTDNGATFGSAATVGSATGYAYNFASSPSFRVLLVGSNSTPVLYSDDYGLSWTAASGVGANGFRSAAWWKNGFIIGDATGGIYTSADGATFSLAATVGTSEIRAVASDGVGVP